jgi:hypothetical protein
MKRFTETTKWRDIWFRRLSIHQKCLWHLICDICDPAGVFEFDPELFSFDIGSKIKESDLAALGDRIQHLFENKWIIKKFIAFQYGKLSSECKPHKGIFSALEKHGLNVDEIEQNRFFKSKIDGPIRDAIIARDGGKCVYTGISLLPHEIEIDHVVPRSKGGSNKPSNLVSMDAKLNLLKGDKTLEDFCIVAKLDIIEIKERLSKALAKGIDTLQEQEKDKEEEEDKKKKRHARGSFEELTEFCRESGLFPRDAEYLWNKWEGNGWQNNGKAMKDWRATVRAWKAQGYLPSQKTPSASDAWPTPAKEEPEEEDLMEKMLRNKAAKEEARRLAEGEPPTEEGGLW